MNKLFLLESRYNEVGYPYNWPYFMRVDEWFEDKLDTYHSKITIYKVITEEEVLEGETDFYKIKKEKLFSIGDSIRTNFPDYQNILHDCLISIFNTIKFKDDGNDKRGL